MNAPKRTPIELLSNDSGFQKALAAVLDEYKAPYSGSENRNVFAYPLTMQAGLAVLPARRYQPDRSKGTGKEWKALLRFPDRLRDFADEVEGLGQGVWFDPKSWVMDDREKESEFVRLPTVMRSFAVYVSERAEQVSPRSGLSHTGKCSLQTDALMDLVKHYTGRYCDQEVCNLLNAAARVIGSKAEFDLQLLMDRRQSKKKPRRRT